MTPAGDLSIIRRVIESNVIVYRYSMYNTRMDPAMTCECIHAGNS